MLRLKIFLSDAIPPTMSMVFFLALYSREASAFGEFSVFLVVSAVISGLITGFLDAEILRGRRLAIQSVTRRAKLSLLFLCFAFLLVDSTFGSLWQNSFLAISVAFSLSISELVVAALIHLQKLALVMYARVISSSLLILIILFIPVADPYAAYTCAVFLSAIFSTLILSAVWNYWTNSTIDNKSVNAFDRLEIDKRVQSAFLRSVGSSPVLFATFVLGKEFAAAILLAQKLLSFPIGSLMNVMVLPLMIRPNLKREQLVRSILPQSLIILTASLVGMSPILFSADSIQIYTVGAFFLVGLRLYCERLMYSSFLILRETSLWIFTLFILDCFALLWLGTQHIQAHVPEPFYVLGAVFAPTIVLGVFLASNYCQDFAKKV